MLTPEFLQVAEQLRVPQSGTEQLAPLLYQLVRFHRPRTVVEVGIGYTTVFILQALIDNERDFQRDRQQLIAKSKQGLRGGLEIIGNWLGLTASGGRFGFSRGENNWLTAEPYAADPGYYLRDYHPHLYAFDNFTSKNLSAEKVMGVVEQLGWQSYWTNIDGDPRGKSDVIREEHRPIDLAWNDASAYGSFVHEYWDLINPDGGLLLLHNTIGSASLGNALIVKELKLRQASAMTDFELITLNEPHKMNQNCVTMVRRTSQLKEKYLEYRGREIAGDLKKLMELDESPSE